MRHTRSAAITSFEMSHSLSSDDRQFCADFAACRIDPNAFDHRAHIQLAYIYLAEYTTRTRR